MASSTDICNLALALLRSNFQLGNLATDNSATARLLRITYPLKQGELLTGHGWNFCKATANLAVIATNPTPVWAFSYAVPGDMLFPRRILSVTATSLGTLSNAAPANSTIDIGNLYAPQEDSNTSSVKFELAEGVLYTNMPNAILEYTQNITTEGVYPPKFTLALAAAIAAYIAPTLTNGDPYQIGPKLEALANKTLLEAKAEDLNGRIRPAPDAESIRAYGGWGF